MRVNITSLCNLYNASCLTKINLKATFSRVLHTTPLSFNVAKVDQVETVQNQTAAAGKTVSDIPSLSVKKRLRKRRCVALSAEGTHVVSAFATAEEYDLEKLIEGLKKQNLFEAKKFLSSADYACSPDVVHAHAKYQVGKEPRDIFFFREGCMVLWNITELESSNLLSFVRDYEEDSYSDVMVEEEAENMMYYTAEGGIKAQIKENLFVLSKTNIHNMLLEKYTYSNAMALSVKLGIWEASLDRYIDSIDYLTNDLKRGNKIRISRDEILRKMGELFALRHIMNLRSDLLDIPDFYWESEQLEELYTKTSSYFSISKRTKVMNEKLNHCVELAELVSSHVHDKYNVRLEWMIIILIMVEVGFEVLHYIDRYMR